MSDESKVELFQLGVGVQFEVPDEVSLVGGIRGVMSGNVPPRGEVHLPEGPIYYWVCAS